MINSSKSSSSSAAPILQPRCCCRCRRCCASSEKACGAGSRWGMEAVAQALWLCPAQKQQEKAFEGQIPVICSEVWSTSHSRVPKIEFSPQALLWDNQYVCGGVWMMLNTFSLLLFGPSDARDEEVWKCWWRWMCQKADFSERTAVLGTFLWEGDRSSGQSFVHLFQSIVLHG